MTISTDMAFTAICRQLDADYLPTFARPLPRELEDLLAQLVEYEIRKQDRRSNPANGCIR